MHRTSPTVTGCDCPMLLSIPIKLLPTDSDREKLRALMQMFNAACGYASAVAFKTGTFGRFPLQKLVYSDLKAKFGLGGGAAQLAADKVARGYRRDKRRCVRFRWNSAVLLRRDTLSYRKGDVVSIWTLEGRIRVPFQARPGFKLSSLKEAKLILTGGEFYIHQAVDVPASPITPIAPTANFLGVDLGIKNIAYDSDGKRYSGAHLNNLRRRNQKLRKRLQAKGTKASKRLLTKRRRKESRFTKDVNHTISKRIVTKAQGTSRGIALEDLKGIRARSITARKPLRRDLNSWGFSQLRFFIDYKSRLAGVKLVVVDPKNTSITCPSCSLIAKENRTTRDHFKCIGCGYAGAADHIAAVNISSRAGEKHGRALGFEPYADSSKTDQAVGVEGSCKP